MSAESRFMRVCVCLYGVFDCGGVYMHLKYVMYVKARRCRTKRVSVCSEVVSQSHTRTVNVCVCVCVCVTQNGCDFSDMAMSAAAVWVVDSGKRT